MSQRNFQGVLIPATTPFTASGEVDAAAFGEHCRWLLGQGAHGLAVFGTTSEANSLSLAEKRTLLEALVTGGVAPQLLMPGTGACALPDAVEMTRAAVAAGCGGVLLLPPFYYKVATDDGLFAYVGELIERVGSAALRVYLYHIPPVAQVGYSHALIERLLSRFPKTVVGIKDSSGDWAHTESLNRSFPQLEVFAGSESFLLANLRAGGAGCITATGNINAAAIANVYANWQSADADALQAAITRRRKIVESYPVIPAIKAVLASMHHHAGWAATRVPLLALAAEKREQLFAQLRADGLEPGGA